MNTYTIAIELLKRIHVPVQAESEQEAINEINQKLMHEGTDFITEQITDESFDSIRVLPRGEQ